MIIYYFSWFMWNLRMAQQRDSGLESLASLMQSNINGCYGHLKAGLELEDPLPMWPMHMARSLSFSPCRSLEYPHSIMADFPQREGFERLRWKLQCLLWHSIRNHMLSCELYSISHSVKIYVKVRGSMQVQ